jgi:hypothetical protein
LPARISETVGFAGLAKCGGAKNHKGRKPDWCFAEPEPPEWAVSANRLLSAGFCFYSEFLKNHITIYSIFKQ